MAQKFESEAPIRNQELCLTKISLLKNTFLTSVRPAFITLGIWDVFAHIWVNLLLFLWQTLLWPAVWTTAIPCFWLFQANTRTSCKEPRIASQNRVILRERLPSYDPYTGCPLNPELNSKLTCSLTNRKQLANLRTYPINLNSTSIKRHSDRTPESCCFLDRFQGAIMAIYMSFSVAAPRLWNGLPGHIRDAQSVGAFRKALKTHLFSDPP